MTALTFPLATPYRIGVSGGPVSVLTLGPSAPWLRLADGRVWRYRYVSALDLLSRTNAEHEAFLDWAQATGFTGVRVAATTRHDPPLSPWLGRSRLPRLFDGLASHSLGAEIIALCDTRLQGLNRIEMRIHVAAVGALAAGSGLPISIELANENGHSSQQADLTDVAFLRELRALIPASIPVSMGCWGDDTRDAYPGGDYSTVHLDRGRETWAEVARIKHLFEWPTRRFVVDDEPNGAGEVDIAGKRSANPARFFAQGVLDRLGDLGSTFHFDLGVPARVPDSASVQQACARAYIAGATFIDGDDTFRFVNDSTSGSITRGADWSRCFKLFGFINYDNGGPSYVVALGVTSDYAPRYVNGWMSTQIAASMPGVTVTEVTR
jgi:hypothetical protein